MLNQEELRGAIGSDAYAQDGDKIGKIGQIYLDDETGAPEFATVNTGIFGTSESFVPLADATVASGRLTVPFAKDRVKDAPNLSTDGGHLSQEQERQIYEYYGMSYSSAPSDSGLPAGGDAGQVRGSEAGEAWDSGAVGRDTSGPTTDEAMTRSEERVEVGTTEQETGRVRLRKYVETEQVQQTVPVKKEKAVLEREPITAENRGEATSGPDISDEEHEVVLREEKPVVQKTTEPVERVRLSKIEQTDEEQVSEEVRKERIETEGDVEDR